MGDHREVRYLFLGIFGSAGESVKALRWCLLEHHAYVGPYRKQIICRNDPFQSRPLPSVLTGLFSQKYRVPIVPSTPEPNPKPILPGRLLALVSMYWNRRSDDRHSAAKYLFTIDHLIQGGLESATVRVWFLLIIRRSLTELLMTDSRCSLCIH